MIVAELTCSREVLAKRDDDCPMCPKPILKGEDYVAKVDGSDKGWMHATCARSYIRHREELEQLNQELDAESVGEAPAVATCKDGHAGRVWL